MRRADVKVLDVVVVLEVHTGDSDPPAPLLAVGREREALRIARVRDRDHHLLVGDDVLDVHVALEVGELSTAFIAVALADLADLLGDEGVDPGGVAKDGAQLGDRLHELCVLLADLAGLERGEALEAHVEDRLSLCVAEGELSDEPFASGVGISRPPDERDHLVEVVERDQEALQHVRAGLGPAKLVLGPADDYLALMADVVLDALLEAQRPRHAVDERDHVDAEGGLHRRVLVELVQHHGGGVAAALELDHEPHARAVGLVAEIRDARDLLLADEVGDLRDQPAVAALFDHEWQLGDDDRLLDALDRLDMRLGAHLDRAAPRGVGVPDPLAAHDQCAPREVRPLHVLHEVVDRRLGVVEEREQRRAHLAEVVRRDRGRHADGDALRAVHEQVREPGRQHERLLRLLVVVGPEFDRLGLDVAEHLGGEPVEPSLRIAHRSRRVVVDRAEVALAVNERVAQRELLRHPDQRVVDGLITVRVVLAHHLADDERGLAEGPIGLQP